MTRRSAPGAANDGPAPEPAVDPHPAPATVCALAALALVTTACSGDPTHGTAGGDATPLGVLRLLAAGGIVLASIGISTAAALLGYSPTRLARSARGRRAQMLLDVGEDDFQVLARVLSIGGLIVTGAAAARALAAGAHTTAATTAVLAVLTGVAAARIAELRAEVVLVRWIPALEPLRLLLRHALLGPLGTVGGWLAAVLRLRRREREVEEDVADEILTAVSDSALENELPAEERHWIEQIVDLKSRVARGVMTPRPDVVFLPREMPIVEAVDRALATGFSRYPVFDESVDRIVGVFYAKDALRLVGSGDAPPTHTVGELVREASFVPQTMNLVELLRHFRVTKRQMAIVRDEYGGTDGVVTLEDVLEEIVGDIEDEYDPESEADIHVVEQDRTLELAGRARIDDVNELLRNRLPESIHYDTVGGWVFTRLGRVPRAGEHIELDGLHVDVVAADDRRVERLRLSVPADSAEANAGAAHDGEGAGG